MSCVLSGASSAVDAQSRFIVFLIDPTPYRIRRCNANLESLLYLPAMGSSKSSFFAPASIVWTPPRLFQPLAVNTEPMEFDTTPSSPTPVPTTV